jgi:hypothetical protein
MTLTAPARAETTYLFCSTGDRDGFCATAAIASRKIKLVIVADFVTRMVALRLMGLEPGKGASHLFWVILGIRRRGDNSVSHLHRLYSEGARWQPIFDSGFRRQPSIRRSLFFGRLRNNYFVFG